MNRVLSLIFKYSLSLLT